MLMNKQMEIQETITLLLQEGHVLSQQLLDSWRQHHGRWLGLCWDLVRLLHGLSLRVAVQA